ncbi:hypothetical protein BOW53_13855 [Solemya pervernicosa gill symbiont]|uniref:DUF1330 domain-containing protein n=2 Tax=Gammaproteobacteria incertae sedis TaxID=118884 RepID=A0A1T2L192_9GAMM|nr:DUF1330 domain-containing protein [Candidatus Reidiella endopervernicosa]OOZ38873.1 hypothetical protein BOW53_13855 [Solemya pervernicosa gill symbiont]QKQ25143.1 DUF1330 domain-containing protein [Candidatus Reidiella endopervernicosa]
MAGYVVIRIEASDPSQLTSYQAVAPSIVEKHQGKFLARGGEVNSLEGPNEARRIIIIEFPSLQAANDFYHSDDYTAARALRKDVAVAEIISVAGID